MEISLCNLHKFKQLPGSRTIGCSSEQQIDSGAWVCKHDFELTSNLQRVCKYKEIRSLKSEDFHE